MKKVVIEGWRTDRGCSLTVDGQPLVMKIALHSPTGFEWGYGGSGPAETSFYILTAVAVARDWKDLCVPIWLYQQFKWDFVAKWEGNHIKEFIDIDAWFKKQKWDGKVGEMK